MIFLKNTKYQLILLAFLLMASLCGFSSTAVDSMEVSPSIVPSIVQKEIDRKLAKFKKTIVDRCTKNALINAEIFIDSIVAEEIKLQRNDTIAFPKKPIRPVLSREIILNDSTQLDPIIGK